MMRPAPADRGRPVMSEQGDPTLLRTKLHRPPVAADVVPRPHLLERLERGRRHPLPLVSTPAGYGKSTLLSLLPRFYDPTEGRITLDGQDLRNWRLADVRRQFAIVLQDNVLFSASIRDNISYGVPDATEDAVREAARRGEPWP